MLSFLINRCHNHHQSLLPNLTILTYKTTTTSPIVINLLLIHHDNHYSLTMACLRDQASHLITYGLGIAYNELLLTSNPEVTFFRKSKVIQLIHNIVDKCGLQGSWRKENHFLNVFTASSFLFSLFLLFFLLLLSQNINSPWFSLPKVDLRSSGNKKTNVAKWRN